MSTTKQTPTHELFPAEGDEPAPPVETIHVTRLEGSGVEWCHHLFSADELPNLSAVFELFGGGRYEFIARAGGPHGRASITARRKVNLAGKSLPLNPQATPEPAAAPVPHVQAPPAGLGEQATLFGFLAAVMNAQAQTNAAMIQAVATIATAQRGGGAADAALASAVQALATAAASKGAQGPDDAFVKGAEMAAALVGGQKAEAPQASDADEFASIANSVATIAGAVKDGKNGGAAARAEGAPAPPGMQDAARPS